MQLQAIATTRAGNFEFTYTRAGNLHTRVLANAIANLPIHGKSILLVWLFLDMKFLTQTYRNKSSMCPTFSLPINPPPNFQLKKCMQLKNCDQIVGVALSRGWLVK